jgi:Zn-dependent protease with chaperone function
MFRMLSGAGRRCVLVAVVRAGFPWGVLLAVLSCPIWLDPSKQTFMRMPIVLVAGWAPASAVVVVLPIRRYGEWAARRVLASADSTRLRNVADQLAIAIGVPTERVQVLDVPMPDVGVFPTRGGNVVVATSGAVDDLARSELEALVASQLTVASNGWVRVATSAQLVGSMRMALLFSSAFVNPIAIPFAFLAFFGGRDADAARDLVADELAARTTSNPSALGRALRTLGQHAAEGTMLPVGLPGFLTDQFWVMSTRQTSSTTITAFGKSRSWTSVDEIALEMRVRAERLERAAHGDWSGFRGLRAWKAGMRNLGAAAEPRSS